MNQQWNGLMLGLGSLRRDRKISTLKLSQLLGISEKALRSYEREGFLPLSHVLLGLCQILECEPWQLFHPQPLQARQRLEQAA